MANFFIAFLSVFFAGQQASILFSFSSSESKLKTIMTRQQLANESLGMTKATNAANYIFWLEQLQPTIRETDENYEMGPDDFKSLELENLQFCYPMRPNAHVLRGIDLHVRHLDLFQPTL
jgi:ATP-binding cassette subfamily B (MDR/TAP) protein 1